MRMGKREENIVSGIKIDYYYFYILGRWYDLFRCDGFIFRNSSWIFFFGIVDFFFKGGVVVWGERIEFIDSFSFCIISYRNWGLLFGILKVIGNK